MKFAKDLEGKARHNECFIKGCNKKVFTSFKTEEGYYSLCEEHSFEEYKEWKKLNMTIHDMVDEGVLNYNKAMILERRTNKENSKRKKV
jgi:hypothetical protein